MNALLQLKYRPNQRLAAGMSGWLLDLFRAGGWTADVVTAVPLTGRRQRQRGFNQAELIAAPLAQDLSLPYVPTALRRARETRSQVGLDPEERRRNVAGAFLAEPEQVMDAYVLLVDDLYTTGSTLADSSRALLEAGARGVLALTIARA